MTHDEIIEMARQAGLFTHKEVQPEIVAFAKLVAEKALAQEKALEALHNENERLGLYKDAYAEQEPPQRTWVGLTDEERSYCVETPFVSQQWANIEAKLKEKNT